jgi:hypothetical protein
MKLARPCLFAMLWLLASLTTQAAHWPEVRLPAGIQISDIGAGMSVSGLPMQARGFTSQQTVTQLVEQFRASQLARSARSLSRLAAMATRSLKAIMPRVPLPAGSNCTVR